MHQQGEDLNGTIAPSIGVGVERKLRTSIDFTGVEGIDTRGCSFASRVGAN